MKAYLLIVAVALLAGCEARKSRAEFTPPFNTYQVGETRVDEFALADGTHVGEVITCDWKRPVVLVPRVE